MGFWEVEIAFGPQYVPCSLTLLCEFKLLDTSLDCHSRIPLSFSPLPSSPEYQLFAFISHMGTSTMCGHYVCHIKKEGR
jgi:ubiquitin C-terminal hydrolase